MRKHFLFLFLAAIAANSLSAQATRGNRVGFIDMEYILENVNSYKESNALLEEKAEKWKQEIEAKKLEIKKVREALTAEKPLLTKSLIEERETEISFLENDLLELQQKRFGPNGLLMSQKALLVKPIQDQVFTAVQDIAEAKKYDFIFDKSSDLSLLFADKRFDVSDQVLRVINRTEKREQLSKKELAEEQAKENKEDAINDNPGLAERQKVLDERKAARDKIMADRKAAVEQKKKEYEERRQKIIDERAAKKNGTVSETAKTEVQKVATPDSQTEAELAKQKAADAKAKAIEERNKTIEDRKKALEERRQQILNERAAKKSETVSETAKKAEVPKTVTTDTKNETELAKQKAEEAKTKTIEERKKIIEDRKKALEERRLKIIQQRDSIKKAREQNLKQ
ncbi:periplasmic chaperone for outer membrane proteins Skp [Flavobacterium glycines]|uniref:Membrane protein n=1 Tax=Flavobacterium glycines TaxID=551990 RepID=A0A511CBC9_9FLAO|nr:OmpH family outer membrane protein [Flavobacterium glycines]GEL09899.1 membrane protein [Flavobacterium glycines]SDI89297.1 periplasmic chaperone for outer membrane proteins Skp [Flavobacterium glycines]